MNCHEHADRPAVGLCLACLRGLCRECAADLGGGLACRGRCEAEVGRLLALREWSLKQPHVQVNVFRQQRQRQVGLGALLGLMGACVFVAGLVWREYVVTGLGALFAVMGLLAAWSSARPARMLEYLRVCPRCGYNLTGNASGRCPECGTAS